MILLLGGAAETAEIAARLLAADFAVLVSTATDLPLTLPEHPRLRRRPGRLDAAGLIGLAQTEKARAIVDATHPYATAAHAAAREAATRLALPYFRYERPAAAPASGAIFAANHVEAAALACAGGRTVLAAIGATNLPVYWREAQRTGARLVARVLPESSAACRELGLPKEQIIAARGPFTTAENRHHLHAHKIAVLVTKDGGQAGGLPEKLAAAHAEHCAAIIVRRPPAIASSFGKLDDLARALSATLRA